MSTAYRIAVVIPARTCPCRQVARVLAQLQPEDLLVVVANGLSMANSCKRLTTSNPQMMWVDAGPPQGPARARNIGVATLDGEPAALLFCDADDQVAPRWLVELARRLLNASAELVGGALRIRRQSGSPIVVVPSIDYRYKQAVFGGNMGITYNAWSALQGFNESFTACEDTDLAWRASDLGLAIKIAPDAIVDVNLKPRAAEFRQRFRWGSSSVRLLQAHEVGLDHLPGFRTLFLHKKATGFATSAAVAALGQWAGQRWAFVSPRIRGDAASVP